MRLIIAVYVFTTKKFSKLKRYKMCGRILHVITLVHSHTPMEYIMKKATYSVTSL